MAEAKAIQFQENEDAASSLDSDILILVSLTGRAMRLAAPSLAFRL